MQEKNYKKFYFLDSQTQKPNEILAKIQNENFTGVIFRKSQNFDKNFVHKILKICKAKKMLVFSHYSNNFPCDVLHLGGEKTRKIKGICSFVWHKNDDFKAISKITPNYIFISPVFKTKTHPEMKPLGVLMAFKIAKNVKNLLPNCKIILLGGMTSKRFFSIKKMDSQNLLYGFAGIRF